MQFLLSPAEGAISSGVGDTGGCKLPDTVTGNLTLVLYKSRKCSNH